MDSRVTELYNEYIHGDMPRRAFLKKLAMITGGASMTNAVLALVEPNYAFGQPTWAAAAACSPWRF